MTDRVLLTSTKRAGQCPQRGRVDYTEHRLQGFLYGEDRDRIGAGIPTEEYALKKFKKMRWI